MYFFFLLSLRASSGLVSDNFQRLNMKHRSYRRRGGGISGSAHKRKAWKQIMKSRGEFVPQKSWSGRGRGGGRGVGSGACFKCGQEGHWAKNCRGAKRNNNSLGSNLKHWYVCQAILRHKATFPKKRVLSTTAILVLPSNKCAPFPLRTFVFIKHLYSINCPISTSVTIAKATFKTCFQPPLLQLLS